MIQLPDNWNEMSHIEQKKFFCRNYVRYGREGEILGLQSWAPEEIQEAYKKWEEEDHGRA